MDFLSPETQKVLAEYRELFADSLEREKRLQEENAKLLEAVNGSGLLPEVAMAGDLNAWYRECMNMRNSLSWRITAPLRNLKKVFSSLKTGGVRLTLQKIKRRLVK